MSEQIICSRCNTPNSLRTIHCTECGNNLRITNDGLEEDTIYIEGKSPEPHQPHPNRRALFPRNAQLVLKILDTDTAIPCDLSHNTITIGRLSAEAGEHHLDLTDYNAATLGVSRMHARINRMNVTLMLLDVGSSNGTKINGERIRASKPYILCDGDEISLGNMRLEVVFQQ